MHRRERLRRALRRGYTLTEIMVVILIIGLITSATAVAVFKYANDSKIKTTQIAARTIRNTASLYRASHDAEACPTATFLRDNDFLDRGMSPKDAWGTPFTIVCEGDAVTVVSLGPDKHDRTADDIREPPPTDS